MSCQPKAITNLQFLALHARDSTAQGLWGVNCAQFRMIGIMEDPLSEVPVCSKLNLTTQAKKM